MVGHLATKEPHHEQTYIKSKETGKFQFKQALKEDSDFLGALIQKIAQGCLRKR